MQIDWASLPSRITDASVWYGAEIMARRDWVVEFSAAEIVEIETAIRCAVQLPDPTKMQVRDFPLPTLHTRLQALLHEVLHGRGFVLLRGLPVARWTKHEKALAFYGLGTHLGNARPQNAQGHLLGHVKDLGLSSDNPNIRIYQTSERQTYHTDSCDVVALCCLHPAQSGGLSSLVSSVTIYNEMRARRPDLLALLFQPIATDRRGEIPPGQKPYFQIPVFNWHANLLSAIYQRQYIESAQRFTDVPPLTPQQIEALDMFDELANDPALHFNMALQAGDVQLVHNHTLLHDRTAFVDWPEPERKRHLLRLWLAPTQARQLPTVFADRYGSITPGQRGGVWTAGQTLTLPFDVAT